MLNDSLFKNVARAEKGRNTQAMHVGPCKVLVIEKLHHFM